MTDYAYVAYLDILGYKELLNADVQEGKQNFKDSMTTAFRIFENVNHTRIRYKAISDSIIITCNEQTAAKEFLRVVRDTYISFLHQGLLIRGGVSYGQHFENNSITYSPALTRAYLLESEFAEFPRIMVDSNVHEMFPELSDGDRIILRTGNHWFLNVVVEYDPDTDSPSYTETGFRSIWDDAERTYILSIPAIRENERVRIKHRWLQDFLIEFAHMLGLDQPKPYLGIFDKEMLPTRDIGEILRRTQERQTRELAAMKEEHRKKYSE